MNDNRFKHVANGRSDNMELLLDSSGDASINDNLRLNVCFKRRISPTARTFLQITHK
jgi:hypothetical protein